ncbi:MAG: hypothetical protein OXU71_02765 [Gammaproteobacteria bacterium]|nr:hypothetical protein [Gammaproteobacteria bacterium]
MTLHEAIAVILESENNRSLTAQEIADLNEEKCLYRRKDNKFPEEWQIRLRVKNYPELFRWTPGVQVAPTEHDKIFLANDSRA